MGYRITPYVASEHFDLVCSFIFLRTKQTQAVDGWDVGRWETQFSVQRIQRQERTPQLFFSEDSLVGLIVWEGDKDGHLLVNDFAAELVQLMIRHTIAAGNGEFYLWIAAADTALKDRLTAAGFERGGERCQNMSAIFAESPRTVTCPKGYRLALANMQSLTMRKHLAELENAVFPWSNCNEQMIAEYLQMPSYRSDLHLLMLDEQDQAVAMCILWLGQANHLACFEPVGTHPAHQRKGLARYLLSEAMRQGFALGARKFSVGAYTEAAAAVYKSVGLCDVNVSEKWFYSN